MVPMVYYITEEVTCATEHLEASGRTKKSREAGFTTLGGIEYPGTIRSI